MASADLGTVVDGLPDGLVAADGDGVVTVCNAAARRLLDLSAAGVGGPLSAVMTLQDLDGNDWYGLIRPYDGLSGRRHLLESSWRSPTGREVLVTGNLLRQRPGGAVTAVLLSLRDARGREQVERSRSDLVATVAHELRSPLTGVKGFTKTLLSKWDRLSEEQKLFMLGTVDADADRITRLIAELLDVARIDSGRLTVRPELVDVVSEVSRQVESLRAAGGRGIEVVAEGAPRVWVDKDKLAQIVANLVENALKHGSGTVAVRIRSAGDGAEVIVDDEGPGIPPELRSRIFTKFWHNGQRGGSGLGLYVVGGLVAAHGGVVNVEDAPGGGARMRVVLPLGTPAGLA